jgi:hypothetical protein
VSTPSRLAFVDTLRHGILEPSSLLPLPPPRLGAPPASRLLRLCSAAAVSAAASPAGMRLTDLAGLKLGSLVGSQVFPAPWAWPSEFPVSALKKNKKTRGP